MPPRQKYHKGASSLNTFDNEKFWNEKAQNFYTSFLLRPLVPERWIEMSRPFVRLVENITERGWTDFAHPQSDAVISLV